MACGSFATHGGWLLLALAAALLLVTSAASTADGSRRALRQVPPPLPSTAASARPAPSFPSLFDALNAAAAANPGESAKPSANLTILVAAVQKAGVINSSLSPGTAWTVFAPTNKAFERKLPRLGLTPAALLANSSLLMQILSYHVVPGGAYNSSSLVTEGLRLTTALAGAPPLVVKTDTTKKDGSARDKPQIEIQGVSNKAEVSVPDVYAGRSVVHIINDVLLPPGISAAPKRATGADHHDDSE